MASKHRKQSQRSQKVALIGAASATATCLTVGAAPAPQHPVSSVPVALAASTGPDYTKLITSLSNSTNNTLFAQGNFQGALASVVQPVVAATGGSVEAGTTQADLLTISGVIVALQAVLDTLDAPDVGGVPGLPSGAGSELSSVFGGASAALGSTVTALETVLSGVQGALVLIDKVPGLPGTVSLADLIPGLTASLTTYHSEYDLPLGGLGTLMGLEGSTTATNFFAQLPSLTAGKLIDGILKNVIVGGKPLSSVPGLSAAVNAVLGQTNGISTPAITAWMPSAGGTYGLPLGGSVGYLVTMPTLDVGPVLLLSTTDTVVAVPIAAAGVTLPGDLATYGVLGTPGLVLPTATGVDTIGGVSLSSFSIPSLGISYTNLNVQGANYYGTNGIDYSNGQNVGVLVTPVGTVPIVYSMGSFYLGDSGFGFSGPSLYTIGLTPAFKVGTAPTQQSADGVLSASALNTMFTVARAVDPTQLTSVTELLGLPDAGASVSSVLGQAYAATVTPVATQYTNYLNENIGSWVNDGADALEQATAAIADVSYQLPGAHQPVVPAAGTQATAQTLVKSSSTTDTVANKQAAVGKDQTSTDPLTNVQNQVRDANTQLKTSIATANAKTKAAAAKASADIEKSVKTTSATLNKIAKDGEAQVKKTVDGAQKTVKDTVKSTTQKTAQKTTQKTTEKAKAG